MKGSNLKYIKVVLLAMLATFVLSGVAVAKKPSENPGQGHTPVTICHHAGPHPANWHTITVDDDAVPAHLAHGDTVGPCPVVEQPPVVNPPVNPPVEEPPVDEPETPVTPDEPQEGNTPKEVHKKHNVPNKPEVQKDVPVAPNTTSTPAVDNTPVVANNASDTLPYTGIDAWLLFVIGAGLLLIGYGLFKSKLLRSDG